MEYKTWDSPNRKGFEKNVSVYVVQNLPGNLPPPKKKYPKVQFYSCKQIKNCSKSVKNTLINDLLSIYM